MTQQENQGCLAPEALERLLATDKNNVMLIDVRSPDEYSEVHVDGAVNIPVENIADYIGEIDSINTIVTICWKGGGRSAQASEILRGLGYKNVYYLCNGTLGWVETAGNS